MIVCRLRLAELSAGNVLRLIAAALVGSLFFVGLAGCQRISEGDFVGKWQSSRAITPIHLAANGEWEIRQDDGTILVRVLVRGAGNLFGIVRRPGMTPQSIDAMDEGIAAAVKARNRRSRA